MLGELQGNWGWLVSDKCLHGSLGDVVIHEGENSIRVLLGHLLGEFQGNWGWLISDKCLHGSLGDVVIHE